jgi:hypothetical protein
VSIYPVRLSEWYPKGHEKHDTMKWLVANGFGDQTIGCLHCKKKHMHWQTAIGHHSLPWGYGDIWCNQRCYDRYWFKRERK